MADRGAGVEALEPFVADASAAALERGERGGTYGLTLLVAWAPEELAAPYATLSEQLQSRLGPDGAYVYPHAHLHCTVATLASFRTGHLRNAPLATQRAHTRAWAQALAAEFRSSHASHGPKTFTLSAKQPFLSCAAACLSYANPTGEVAALRSLARRSRDRLGATHPEVPTGTDDFNVPGIIHSTVLRFARAPPAAETARVRRDFESIAATWSDVDVSVARAYLAIEDSAYMHVDRATRVAAVFDLATGDAAGWALAADDRGAAIVSPLEE